jgi:hypothetical protein
VGATYLLVKKILLDKNFFMCYNRHIRKKKNKRKRRSMKYTLEDKTITIPDAAIEKSMATLGLTKSEAVDLYLSDEGLIVNGEIAEMTNKAKASGVGAKATGEKVARKAPVRKPDETKRELIARLTDSLSEMGDIETYEVTNIERMIAFTYGGEKYELTLTKKRAPKK